MKVAIHRTGAPFVPELNRWVLAYWPHLDRTFGKGSARNALGGWFPTRRRPPTPLRPYEAWAVRDRMRNTAWLMAEQSQPLFWTPLLPPDPSNEAEHSRSGTPPTVQPVGGDKDQGNSDGE